MEHAEPDTSIPAQVPVGGGAVPVADYAGVVRRERLLAHLSSVDVDVPLVGVVAPAGYGKTTVLSQWAQEDRRRFGWVSLDAADRDPARLVRHLARALNVLHPLDDAAWRVLDRPDAAQVAAAVARLTEPARRHRATGVLVLDGLEVLPPDLAEELVATLVDCLPAGGQVAVGARRRPGLRLARLRGRGRLVEVGPSDLALRHDEAGAVLAGLRIVLSTPALHALVRRTEGWPAGVYLAALGLGGHPDVDAGVDQITGADPYLAEYFRDEVLAHESVETVSFLLHTAILERLHGSLCDAVLQRSGSAARLAELAGRHVFVRRDDEDGWYRQHPLFAEMLLSQLRQRDSGAQVGLHRRAATWHEEHDLPEPAIRHALAGEDILTAARLVSAHGQGIAAAGRIPVVRDWMESLDGALESYPPLAVAAGWTWALTGDAARAQHCLLAAERGSFDGAPPDGSTSFTSGLCMLRATLAPLGVERMLADARRALDLEPPDGPWYPLAALLVGAAHMLNAHRDSAVTAFEHAAFVGRERLPSAASSALAQLSLLAAEEGNWPAAKSSAADALHLVEAGGLHTELSSLLPYTANARVAAHAGDAEQARRHLDNARRLYVTPSPLAFPWLATQTAIALGRIALDLGDTTAAERMTQEAGRHLSRLLTEGVLREHLRRLTADIADGPGRADGTWLSPAELRVLQMLQTHLTLGDIADSLYISRNTVKAQVAAVYRKLNVTGRTEAVRAAHTRRLLD